jgi:signal transduction histidine kinase
VLYASPGFDGGDGLLDQTGQQTRTYRVIEQEGAYYIQTGTAVNALDRVLYLETMKDRSLGFSVYRRVTVAMLLCGTAVMYLIASFLTRPIRLLTRATKRMASGDYHHRARKVSSDELGQLTTDFNRMANALEDNINQLEDEIQAREDFVAAFAHELKTPLTSIIGYADALRSRRLDEEKQFMSANYIYTEGKRLEAMSFRLLDIMVTRRGEVEFTMVSAESLFLYLYDMYVINKSMKIYFNYDDGIMKAEANLIKSVLMNLLDNACKASDEDGLIEVYGHLLKDGYCFEVKDHGVGIPEAEQHKITKAFYMVDKSRSRSRNGAGLGLALCAEILELHGSRLNVRSALGKGTTMSFTLPLWKEDQS